MKRVVACAMAAALGIGMASWHNVAAFATGGTLTREEAKPLKSMPRHIEWARPKPGSWSLAQEKQGDGLPPVIKRIKTAEKVVFITIDDGWVHDPGFVEIVRRQRVPVTVFLTDQAARSNYRYFWTLQNAGASIENHTIDHAAPSNDMRNLTAEHQKRQICDTSNNFIKQYGRRPLTFRPPGGSYNETTRQAARDCGIKSVVLWSLEQYNGLSGELTRDGGGSTAFQPGDIILLHFRQNLAADFTKLLGWIRQQGFRPAALENYLPASMGGTSP